MDRRAAADETIEDFPVRADEHVTVEEKQNGRFRVTVPRQGATRSEWVAPGSVDEVLGAAVDLYLLGKPNISWVPAVPAQPWPGHTGIQPPRRGRDPQGRDHMAVATGDGQDVYSLWNRPQHYPVRVGLAELWAGETTIPTI